MDYVSHWLLTASIGYFLLLCALVIRFFRTRAERRHREPM
jgi:hypothetical protein